MVEALFFVIINVKGSLQKKKCKIFYIGGGVRTGLRYTFFSKTWSKMV